MLNLVALSGKITKVYRDEKGRFFMLLAVERDFREKDGNVLDDILTCTLWQAMFESIEEYYRPGQTVTISGHLEVIDDKMVVIGEKIAFSQRYARCRTKEE